MQHNNHPTNETTETPFSGHSPLAPCFPPDWAERPNWEAVAPHGMKSAWLRRLSWQTRDSSLAALVKFLEQNGKTTRLEVGEWQAELNGHLAHKPNRHFVFLLLYRHLEGENVLKNLRLEAGLENLFIQWKTRWERDINLTASVRNICSDKPLKEITRFRGISICEAMSYPTFRIICAEHQSE